jgi:hypothetical protein
MYAKWLAMIVFAAAVAGALLTFRQQRFEAMNAMAREHGRINRAKQQMWDLQVRIADKMQPMALEQAIHRNRLELEPQVPQAVSNQSQASVDTHVRD